MGFRSIRRRPGRFALTAVGVALGVGVLFAVLITNSTIDEGMDRFVRTTDTPMIEMSAAGGYETDMPAAVLGQAAALPGVVDVTGGTGVGVHIPNAPDDKEGLFLYGGLLRNGSASPPKRKREGSDIITRGRDAADDKDEVVLSEAVASQMHASRGSSVEFVAPTGRIRLRVVGITVRRDGRPHDDRSAATSYPTARRLVGRGEVVNFGTIRLASGTDAAQWIADHGAAFGAAVQLTSSGVFADAFRDVIGSGKAALGGLAGVALFVSGFMIFLTLSMNVAEAAAVHGTMRAVGASRGQIRRTVLTDALALVLLSTPAGLVFGLLAANLTIRLTRAAYGLPSLTMTVRPISAVVALLVGVGVTLAAAMVPAQRAAAVAPVVAIRGAGDERPGAGRLWIAGLAAIVAGFVVVFASSQKRVDVGSSFILFGAVLVVPAIMGPIAGVAGLLTRRLARGVGTVGVLHLRKEPRRSAYTLALVMVVLAMVFATGAVHLSLRRNLTSALARQFPADLAVYGAGRLDAPLRETIATTPGVDATTPLWFTRTYQRTPTAANVDLMVLDAPTFFAVQSVAWREGSDRAARAALTRGGAVAIPDGTSRRQRVHRGDTISLDTSSGAREFVVAGVYVSSQSRSPVLVGAGDGTRLFGVEVPTAIAATVKPGFRVDAVKTAIERRAPGLVFVRSTSAQKADYLRGQTQFFNLVYALVLIALIMGMLGVTNTLAMAVLRRTREIGVLRAVGTERRQLRRMALVEAMTLGLTGLALAIPLGVVLSVTVLQTVTRTLGTAVEYIFPWPMFAVIGPIAVLAAALSAVVPGRHAARVDPARVLRFD
ncbi:MAG TPA: FtsX-like permease family protein [Acidimicrobiales bacterium]|nr:FtsX-like permease family protein [Acidimicrobiales bacterium]